MITLQITGVGTEPILANARHYDIEGNPRRKIREMLFQELVIKEGDGFLTGHKNLSEVETYTRDVVKSLSRETRWIEYLPPSPTNGRRRKLATYPERVAKSGL